VNERSDTGSDGLSSVQVLRVRKAYEQVADQLRELILVGSLAPDQRLPSEAALATQFGVSRATIREALRVLATQSLIRTSKGAGGGSFVSQPSVDNVSDLLSANMSLLGQSEDVSLDDFLEAREYLEVPAARLAAQRRSEAHLDDMQATIPEQPLSMTTAEQFTHNRDFHSRLVASSGNPMLTIATRPIFSVLQTHLQRSSLGQEELLTINQEHAEILEAVKAGDAEATAEQMLKHLESLRPMYERTWRYARRSKP